ncbi:MAG: alanine racemase [Chloroflexota bacterium]|nr:alanine racemase [Chloroflexota bacterium]
MHVTGSSIVKAIAEHWNGRPVLAVVDLDALAVNVQTLRTLIGPDVRLQAVVKANAYGHGDVPIARSVLASGADSVAVATVDEAVQLRASGIAGPLMVLGPIGRQERARAIGHDLAVVVSDAAFARGLAADARMHMRKDDDPVPVHLKIDTGMRRFGAPPEQAVEIARVITESKELRLDGLMTHFAAADDPDPASARQQMAVFDACIEALTAAGLPVPLQHVANSAATMRFPEYHRGQVRAGISLYGLRPEPGMVLPEPMRPVLSVFGRIARVIDLEPGDTVSYGRTYVATRPERAGLVPIGYADGYPRGLSSQAWMTLGEERTPVLGRVCMDQTVVRLPHEAPEAPGAMIRIVGDGHDGAPTIDDLAEMMGTISYELATGLAQRLPKIYVSNGEVVAVNDLHGYRDLA